MYSNSLFDALYKGIGHNNGNLAFVYSIVNQIDAEITYFPWHITPEKLKDIDAVVIPCANQFGKHTELGGLANILRKAGKPIIAIGLGAQASNMEADVQPSEGTVDWVRAIGQHRPTSAVNIYTRGPYTTTQLQRFGFESVVGGCPSHFMNPAPDLGMRIEERWNASPAPRAISVAGGHQSWREVRVIEQQLVAMMQDPLAIGQYVVQSMDTMIKLSREAFDEIEPDKLEQARKHLTPHLTMDEFKNWCRNYARSFYDVPAWMDSLRRYDLTIGPRFHGTQLAVQAERMGVCITIDSRTEEMCQQTGVPFLRAADLANKPLTRSTIKELVKFSGKAHDRQRSERARNYIRFLRANNLKPKPYLLAVAGIGTGADAAATAAAAA